MLTRSFDRVLTRKITGRADFLTKTYLHLAGAIAALTAIEVFLFESGLAAKIAAPMYEVPWLLILGAFMVAGWMARRLAHRLGTLRAQYAGLALYVVAKSIILVPVLYSAERYAPGAISTAAQFTAVATVGLTLVALLTRKDFSFLRGMLFWAGWLALILIVCALLFQFYLGLWFSFGMVALAGASILYDTSEALHRYSKQRYVAAALELFASIALMFWYALRIFRRLRSS